MNKAELICAWLVAARLIGTPAAAQEITVIRGGQISTDPGEARMTFGPRVVEITREPNPPLTLPRSPRDVLSSLLSDRTLRTGDAVMFPEGPRVFIGNEGGPHSLFDFAPIAEARSVLPSLRRQLMSLRARADLGWGDVEIIGAAGSRRTQLKAFEVLRPASPEAGFRPRFGR